MKKILMLCSLFLLGSCAPNYVKVIRLDASGQYFPFVTAATDGCMVEVKRDLNDKDVLDKIIVVYTDEKCEVMYGK